MLQQNKEERNERKKKMSKFKLFVTLSALIFTFCADSGAAPSVRQLGAPVQKSVTPAPQKQAEAQTSDQNAPTPIKVRTAAPVPVVAKSATTPVKISSKTTQPKPASANTNRVASVKSTSSGSIAGIYNNAGVNNPINQKSQTTTYLSTLNAQIQDLNATVNNTKSDLESTIATTKSDLQDAIATAVSDKATTTELASAKSDLEQNIATTKTSLETNIADTKADLESNIATTKSTLQGEISEAVADKVSTSDFNTAKTDLQGAIADTRSDLQTEIQKKANQQSVDKIIAAFDKDTDNNLTNINVDYMPTAIPTSNIANLDTKLGDLEEIKETLNDSDTGYAKVKTAAFGALQKDELTGEIDSYVTTNELANKSFVNDTIDDAIGDIDFSDFATNDDVASKFNSMGFKVENDMVKFSTDKTSTNDEDWSEVAPVSTFGGSQGPDGKSAYELWVAAGHTGTLEEFLASLKGQDAECARTIDYDADTKKFMITGCNAEPKVVPTCEPKVEKVTYENCTQIKTTNCDNQVTYSGCIDPCTVTKEVTTKTDNSGKKIGNTVTFRNSCNSADKIEFDVDDGEKGEEGDDACDLEYTFEAATETVNNEQRSGTKFKGRCPTDAENVYRINKFIPDGKNGTDAKNIALKINNDNMYYKYEDETWESAFANSERKVGSVIVDDDKIEQAVDAKLEQMQLPSTEDVAQLQNDMANKANTADLGDFAYKSSLATTDLPTIPATKLAQTVQDTLTAVAGKADTASLGTLAYQDAVTITESDLPATVVTETNIGNKVNTALNNNASFAHVRDLVSDDCDGSETQNCTGSVFRQMLEAMKSNGVICNYNLSTGQITAADHGQCSS